MDITDGSARQARLRWRLFIARHRVALGASVAGVAALIIIVTGTVPREAVPSVTAAAAVAPEKFEYFPDLYVNQARHIEDPIATF